MGSPFAALPHAVNAGKEVAWHEWSGQQKTPCALNKMVDFCICVPLLREQAGK